MQAVTTITGMSKNKRDTGLVSPAEIIVLSITWPPDPRIKYKIIEISAAGMEYFSRLRTTPPRSASCVDAEAMVVSETGERLSPKAPPEIIAPISNPGVAPTKYPTG